MASHYEKYVKKWNIEHKEGRAEYMRAYRKKNRKKLTAYNREWTRRARSGATTLKESNESRNAKNFFDVYGKVPNEGELGQFVANYHSSVMGKRVY